jgi:hypothetical protein
MTDKTKEISIEIKDIFEQNELDDLKRFLAERQRLNMWNKNLLYLFHLVQSAGILTTTIAAGYDQKFLIWIGVGLNMFASLIDIYEKTNNKLLKKLMADIQKIRDGSYVDEGELVETDDKKNSISSPQTKAYHSNKNDMVVISPGETDDSITNLLLKKT